MTGKHQRLLALSQTLPVPPLLVLGEEELAGLWTNHAELREALAAQLSLLHSTASAFLDEQLTQIQRLLRPRWRSDAAGALHQALERAGLCAQEALAVRSSGLGEDDALHSHAGLYLTRLNVLGLSALQAAIEAVWASGFGRAAVIERLRRGALQRPFAMSVIVQRMVGARWAGVAFSHDPVSGEAQCTVEAVAGLGEALVSGAARGAQARVRAGRILHADQDLPRGLVLRVAALTEQARQALHGVPTDIEWAFDGERLWLLQARPITNLAGPTDPTDRADAVWQAVPLYAADEAQVEPLRPLPDFAQYFRGKRKPLADFAQRQGLPAATALLLRANAAGLQTPQAAAAWAALREDQVVLDFSERIRQQALPREGLAARLQELLGAAPAVFVVRDFVQGRVGLISQPATAGQVLCEWSAEGLLAINRGMASTQRFVLDAEGRQVPGGTEPGLGAGQLGTLHRVTQAAQALFGRSQLEWVLQADGGLHLIDYSALEGLSADHGEAASRVISPGYARGQALVVDATRDLEQLSIAACVSLSDIPSPETVGGPVAQLFQRLRAQGQPSIVVAPRPYAALAPLVPYAAGFLFEKAATLCHLAILLREHGVPALACERFYGEALREAASATQRPLVLNACAQAPA
jgi:hypothetical protein